MSETSQRRPNGTGTIRNRGTKRNPQWYGYASIYVDGRRRQLSKGPFPRKGDAERWLAEAMRVEPESSELYELAAQLAKGNFTPDPVSVGQLFAAAMIPGLILAGMYIVYVLVQALISPARCPAIIMSAEERRSLGGRVFTTLFPPLLLIIAVLGFSLGLLTPEMFTIQSMPKRSSTG